MTISVSDLSTIRSQNQSTDLYLGLFLPEIVFEARITGTVSKGMSSIDYYGVLSGSYTGVIEGMSLYVGSEPEGDDLGRVRVRSITSGTVNVAIDKSIDYAIGQYITIRNFHEFWPVFPRATVNDSNIISYFKDYDIPYTNQNSIFNPTVIMGCDYFGFFNDHPSGTAYFNATGSYIVDNSTIGGYLWTFPTGTTPLNRTDAVAGWMHMPQSGFYTVSCYVSGTNGKTSIGYRHEALFNRPGTSSVNLPIADWELKDISGDWDIGFTAKIEVGEGADKFRDGYLVGIWADDYYNNIKQSFGGFYNREHIIFLGYVSKSDTFYNPFTSKTTFYLRGITTLLKNKEMFSISLESHNNPGDWTYLKDMTIPKIIDHYFRWHSTLFNIVDVTNIQTVHKGYGEHYEDITKGEIFSTVNNLLESRLFGKFVSDNQNRCFAEIDLNILPTGTRPASEMTFIDQDWINNPKFTEDGEKKVASVLLGGVTYISGTGADEAYLSRAPGTSPAYDGKSDTISGLTLNETTPQDEINAISGLYFAKENARITGFNQELGINIRNINIIPQKFYNRSLISTDTFRKIVWNNKRFIPRKITYTFKNGFLQPSIDWEAETYGTPGETVLIPVTPPKGTRPRRVSLRPVQPRQPGVVVTPGDGNTVYVATTDKIARTRNFLSTSPNWANVTGGVTGTIADFILDPFDPKNKAWCLTSTGVWKTANLNSTSPTWTLNLSKAQIGTLIAGDTNVIALNLFGIKAIITASGNFAIHLYTNISGIGRGNTLRTVNNGVSWTSQANYATFPTTDGGGGGFDWSQHSSNKMYVGWMWEVGGGNSAVVNRSDNNGVSWNALVQTGDGNWSAVYDLLIPYNDNLNDAIIYAVIYGTVGHIVRKSIDYGASWSNITPAGFAAGWTNPKRYFIHAYTQDRNIMFVSDGVEFWFSTNAGTTWVSRSTFLNSCAFGGFPYNGGLVYRLRNASITSAGLGADPAIYTSIDGGYNWLNKTGDWATVIGNFNTGIMCVPVWVG